MSLARRLAHWLAGEYALYRIFAIETASAPEVETPAGMRWIALDDANPLTAANDPELAALAGYAGDDATGCALLHAGVPVTACWFWHGERYRRRRNFWPLAAGEAKLVQITTAQDWRGRGLAPLLLGIAVREMARRGFVRLYARVWHSNTPSVQAFRKAGWREVAFVAELHPFGRRRPLRFVWRRRN